MRDLLDNHAADMCRQPELVTATFRVAGGGAGRDCPPGAFLASRSPPNDSTIDRAMARPIPKPSFFVEKKGSNIRLRRLSAQRKSLMAPEHSNLDSAIPYARGRPGVARRARDLDQPTGRLHQPMAVRVGLQSLDEGFHGVHGRPL